MTVGERQRTCSYHWITFKTWKEFKEHWDYCSVRVCAGHIDLDNLGCA